MATGGAFDVSVESGMLQSNCEGGQNEMSLHGTPMIARTTKNIYRDPRPKKTRVIRADVRGKKTIPTALIPDRASL